MPAATTAPELRRLSKRELHARYSDLQQEAQACFGDGTDFDSAQARAAPLIERADAIATEIVRRARRTARQARTAVYATSALAIGLVAWLVLQG